MDVPFGLGPVSLPKAEPADAASGAVEFDALSSGLRATLVCVDRNLANRALKQGLGRQKLIG